jgi:hypothetical protein
MMMMMMLQFNRLFRPFVMVGDFPPTVIITEFESMQRYATQRQKGNSGGGWWAVVNIQHGQSFAGSKCKYITFII